MLQLATTVPTTSGGTQTESQSCLLSIMLYPLSWAGNSGTPAGGDHCGTAPSGITLSTYQQPFSYDDLDGSPVVRQRPSPMATPTMCMRQLR
jgi:hypothetical protein